jgi:hypothetical protein
LAATGKGAAASCGGIGAAGAALELPATDASPIPIKIATRTPPAAERATVGFFRNMAPIIPETAVQNSSPNRQTVPLGTPATPNIGNSTAATNPRSPPTTIAAFSL